MNREICEIVNEILQKSDNKYQYDALSTGFKDLDKILGGGIRNGDLIVIGGRPGIGKTSLAISIAKHVVQNENIPTAFFSLEMSHEMIISRYFNMTPKLDNLLIDDHPSYTISELKSVCKSLKKEKDIGLIVVDYLQLLSWTSDSKNRAQNKLETAEMLKELACELNIPVVIISHISRGYKHNPNHKPSFADVLDYGSLEQEADIVMVIYRDDHYEYEMEYRDELEESCVGEILVLKHRNGDTGTVNLWWNENEGWSDYV